MVKLIQPLGEPDLEIANAARKLRGLPPAQMEWVCQHLCAAETIPDCQDVNCEGTLIVGQGDVENLRGLVARRELAAFNGVEVQLRMDLPRGVGVALQRFVQGAAELPRFRRQQRSFTASGSLLDFARLCALRLDPGLSAGASNVLREIEQVLVREFSCGGPVLFQQRFVDPRTRPVERGNTITLLARAVWPARALVAWEGPSRRLRRQIAPPVIPEANTGFGLWSETGAGIRLGFTGQDLTTVPGDLYGPRARLVFRVDQELVDRVQGLCEARAAAPLTPPFDMPMLDLLEAITGELGLPAPMLPPATGTEEMVCVRPAQFIHRLLLAQPYPHL